MRRRSTQFLSLLLWLVRAAIKDLLLLQALPKVVRGAASDASVPHLEERGLIVGGQDAVVGEFEFFVWAPGQAAVCGASLYHSDMIITAAHCWEALVDAGSVFVGGTLLDGSDGEEIAVEAVFIHEGFDEVTWENDIMVAKLAREATNVRPVSLNTDGALPADGSSVTVIGLGRLRQGGISAPTLQKVDVSVIDTAACEAYWEDPTSLVNTPIDGDLQICAGTEEGGKDACQGKQRADGPIVGTVCP